MKAIEKARKQEQMSTDGQSMASTVPPEDGSWLLAVPEELAAPLTVCALQ
jgi:hypothetical protein